MKRTLLLACFVCLTQVPATGFAAADTSLAALQTLAVQIKQAADGVARGRAQAPDLAGMHHGLRNFETIAAADAGSAFAQKYRAVERLLAKLEYDTAHAPARPAATPPARVAVDREVLGAARGQSCAAAFGLSTALPVEFTLGAAGQSGSDAWFRLDAQDAGNYVFSTDSAGADPAIEIYAACSATPLATNDDAVGLDAQATAMAAAHAPLFVHVTNSGAGGSLLLSVTTADATIAGTITDAATGLGISYPSITLYSSAGNSFYAQVQADNLGHYSVSVPAAQYYVRADANQHVGEAYPNAQCALTYYYSYTISNCDPQHAQLVTATSGATTSGIDIALGIGQRIAGTVRDQNNQPVPNAEISLMDALGNSTASTTADTFGRYQIPTLPNGTYTLRATGNYYNDMYAAQLYNHVTCSGPFLQQCDISKATPLTVANQDLIGIDFGLQQLAAIRGTVFGASPQNGNSFVNVVSVGGNTIVQGYADAQGNYSAGPLPIGQYYAYAVSAGNFSQLYPSINCDQTCLSSLSSATLINITQQGQLPQIDFHMTALPLQHGHVQDAISGQPVPGVVVYASAFPPANFAAVGNATTDANGNYALPGTLPGSYYLWAQSTDHIDQIYSGIACEVPGNYYYYNYVACDVTGASLMTITPSTVSLPDANFALQPSSSISGRTLLRATPGSAIPATNTTVQVYDVAGSIAGNVNVDSQGNYTLYDLAPGTYFAAVNSNYSYYTGQIWQNIDCPITCVPTQGTPIVLGANTAVTGVDFSLLRRDAIFGQVTDDQNAPIAGVLIDIFDASTLGYFATVATDAQGNYLISGNIGSAYFVATEAPGNYFNQIYSGVSCGFGSAYQHQCPFTNATPVSLPYASSQAHVVNFVLSPPPDHIFASKFE